MSWTTVQDPYQTFIESATSTTTNVAPSQWSLHIWEKTRVETTWFQLWPLYSATPTYSSASLAPLDLPRIDALSQTLELYQILGIPREFTTERLQSVSHSFRRSTDRRGTSTWFHFLCKNIDIKQDGRNAPEVDNRAATEGYHAPPTLPQADYSYYRSGFFLRANLDGNVTLVCFGPTPKVQQRLREFISNQAYGDVPLEPYILFDLLLDGLHLDVDSTVWKMNHVFGSLEHLILEYANKKGVRKMTSKIPFAAMHNCAKHIVHIAEALESCVMLTDATLENVSDDDSNNRTPERDLVVKQLRECLRYRRSLFRSSQLRLDSLQKRIDNAITLSFNIVTQQDSLVMTQDSNSMKIIAAITMIFLPTTGVATIVGSQLFMSELDETSDSESWRVLTTPLFWIMWWIAIPLTVFVAILAVVWIWWTHAESPKGEVVHVVQKVRAATFTSSVKNKK